MKNSFSSTIDTLITVLLYAVAGLTPLLFFNQTTEFFEMPKLIFLVVVMILLIGLWIFSWIAKGRITINRTPLDMPLLLLLITVLLSTYFSTSRYAAIYGDFPRVHGSAVAWVTYILLYFVAASQLNTLPRIKNLIYVLSISGAVVALLTLMSFFRLFLPFDFAKTVTFTPTGSTFSTVAMLLLLLSLPLLSVLHQNRYFQLPVAIVLAILFSVTIVLVGSIPGYIALAIVYILCAVSSRAHMGKDSLVMFAIPVFVTLYMFLMAYLPFPGNFVQKNEQIFPKEIQLPLKSSWVISASAFRDAPFLGTGPSTYLYNFTSYKPVEFNSASFWSFSFDTAYDEFLQILGTLGLLGIIGILSLSAITLANGFNNYKFNTDASREHNSEYSHIITAGLAISGITAILLLALHATTLVSTVVTLLLLAALMMSQQSIRERVFNLTFSLNTTSGNKQFNLLPVIIFVIFLIIAIPTLYTLTNVVRADYYHRQALATANTSGSDTYKYLQKAEALNPYIDLYRVDMAQTNFALANAIVLQKGPTKDDPKRTLSDDDKKTVQTLLSQSINEGRVSVALSPLSSRNWEVLASIYRNIAGVAQNALTFSLDAYGRAIQVDPMNPLLRLNVGGIYYSVKNYDMAIRFFTDAANLKPDYANAYYNLAIALRDKGDIANAAAVAERMVSIVQAQPKSQDYKIATDLYNNLKAAAATGSATTGQVAPASTTNSALNNGNISNVNVDNLKNPPSVATPSAVKANPKTQLPELTPSTTPRRSPTPAR